MKQIFIFCRLKSSKGVIKFQIDYKINVMISIQEIITHLQHRIQEYRLTERRVDRAKQAMISGKVELISASREVIGQILREMGNFKSMAEGSIMKVSDYYESQILKQKRSFERELYELQQEIQRQYKVISSMREQVEDLQELIIMQNAKNQTNKQGNQYPKQEEKNQEIPKLNTVYELEVIQEETERTAMSSVKSFHEEVRMGSENFIKIEEKENESYSESDCISNKKESSVKVKDSHQTESLCEQDQFSKNQEQQSLAEQSQEKSSICKLDQINMNSSNASKRQNTYQYDQNSQQAFEKYESLPLSMNGYITKEFNAKEFIKDKTKEEFTNNCLQLREITNQINHSCSEQDRQYKTKMFLEEFRKTFNRCLSSANISRKTSAKVEKTDKDRYPPKSKSKQDKKRPSKEKVKTATKVENQRGNSQKLLNDMLKDTYNNSKFQVGDRRTEQKYQGQKKDNVRHGHGKLLYSNGLCYQGEFKDGVRHGYGILRFNATEIYRGEWQDDEMSGQGKIKNFGVINKTKSQSDSPLLKWVNYCGYFKSNRFEGEGTLYLQAGEKFLGKFICGAACGEGTLYKKNGQIETGVWRNNQLVEQF